MNYMKESSAWTFVYSQDHPLIERDEPAAIAVSCYFFEPKKVWEIGFDSTSLTKRARTTFVNNSLIYDGAGFRVIKTASEADFVTNPNDIHLTGKFFVMNKPSKHQSADESPQPSEDILKKLACLIESGQDFHMRPNAVAEIANVCVKGGYQLLFFPHMTPYESFCLFYGSSVKALVEQIEVILDELGMELKQCPGHLFPLT